MKQNIIEILYKYSPMNFYMLTQDNKTIISSISTSKKNYKFDKIFSQQELNTVWKHIKIHKKLSVIFILTIFILSLYTIIFPNYSKLLNNTWYLNFLVLIGFVVITCFLTSSTSSIIFKTFLKKNYGNFETVKHEINNIKDEKYYKLYKKALIKMFLLIAFGIIAVTQISPTNITKQAVLNEDYTKALAISTIGIKILPISPELYALRGYTNFKLGEYQKAIDDYDNAYKYSENEYKLMNFDNKIYIKYFLSDYKGAVKDFKEQIRNAQSDETKDEFMWDEAQFLYNIGEYKKSLALYNLLIDKAENDKIYLLKDRLYLERSEVYGKLGNLDAQTKDIKLSQAGDFSGEIIPKPVLLPNIDNP